VHLSRVAQDHSLGRARVFRPGEDGAVLSERYVLELSGPSVLGEVVRTGRPVNIRDARESPLLVPHIVERFSVASALFLPLSFEGEVRSVAVLVSERLKPMEEPGVQLAHTFASQASAALAVLEMRGRMQRRADQQAALARAARTLNASLEPTAVLDTLCREADLALGGDVAGFYLGDGETGGTAVAGHGIEPGSDWFGYVLQPGEGVGGQVLATGEPVISNAYGSDLRVPANDVLSGLETAVSVPVRWNGELKGALSVGFYSMRRVNSEDIETLQALAGLAAGAITNAQAFEAAQEAARTDSLTGLLNHGAVHSCLRQEIARARRTGEPLSCLVVDLDNFKPINDVHGHLAGDQVLREVADALGEEFRAYDGVGRFGGDEFVIVLPGVDEHGAEDAALRVQAALAGPCAAELGETLTASVGIARWRDPLSPAELVGRADRALLSAKRHGKGRARTAASEDPMARAPRWTLLA
jgi:eukaryotic-like serine/threonine-protein kinase